LKNAFITKGGIFVGNKSVIQGRLRQFGGPVVIFTILI